LPVQIRPGRPASAQDVARPSPAKLCMPSNTDRLAACRCAKQS